MHTSYTCTKRPVTPKTPTKTASCVRLALACDPLSLSPLPAWNLETESTTSQSRRIPQQGQQGGTRGAHRLPTSRNHPCMDACMDAWMPLWRPSLERAMEPLVRTNAGCDSSTDGATRAWRTIHVRPTSLHVSAASAAHPRGRRHVAWLGKTFCPVSACAGGPRL